MGGNKVERQIAKMGMESLSNASAPTSSPPFSLRSTKAKKDQRPIITQINESTALPWIPAPTFIISSMIPFFEPTDPTDYREESHLFLRLDGGVVPYLLHIYRNAGLSAEGRLFEPGSSHYHMVMQFLLLARWRSRAASTRRIPLLTGLQASSSTFQILTTGRTMG